MSIDGSLNATQTATLAFQQTWSLPPSKRVHRHDHDARIDWFTTPFSATVSPMSIAGAAHPTTIEVSAGFDTRPGEPVEDGRSLTRTLNQAQSPAASMRRLKRDQRPRDGR